MRVCILVPAVEEKEALSPLTTMLQDPTPYLGDHQVETHRIHKATAYTQIRELIKQSFDVFFNLCDGVVDDIRPGVEVVQALEKFQVPFTGADSRFYNVSREATQMLCVSSGLRIPTSFIVESLSDLDLVVDVLCFPIIVRPLDTHDSIGLTRDSRVETVEQLQLQVRLTLAVYGKAFLQEFIEGSEWTVLVAENPLNASDPLVYQPMEVCFAKGESFQHFDLKWKEWHKISYLPCIDPDLTRELQENAKSLFLGLGGTGYARCDFRMNLAREVFVLEINPNCGVFYPQGTGGCADAILSYEHVGHTGFAETLFAGAFARQQRNRRMWSLRYDRKRGYGMYATTTIQVGAMIESFEERTYTLVSKSYVMQHWNPPLIDTFLRYAWPLSDEIFVTWSADPGEWKPINHSCDPNSWYQGLDLVARRMIAPGEEITLDYATFYNEQMPSFACSCGTMHCRGIIHGTDYLSSVVALYGEHVSDYVKTRRIPGYQELESSHRGT